jgi:hypothetical protein
MRGRAGITGAPPRRPGLKSRATYGRPLRDFQRPLSQSPGQGRLLVARDFNPGRCLGLLFWLFLAAPLLAQPSQVTVSLTPTAPTVGDHVQATLTLRAPTANLAADPRFPVWGKTWGEVEVVSGTQPVKLSEQGGIAVWEQRITLAAFKTGNVPLPPVAVAIPYKTGTVQAQTPAGLALAVRSVIPPGEKDPALRPPAPPRSLPLSARFWWTLAALTAACLGAAGLLWLQHRRRKSAPGMAPALPPFEELAAEIDRLRREPSMLVLHTGLSFALRRYLGRRLPFPAVESTSSDIQRQLLSRRMPGPLVRQTVELLRACDLVKFARQEVGEAQGHERAEVARRLAGEWESHLAPRATEALEATG